MDFNTSERHNDDPSRKACLIEAGDGSSNAQNTAATPKSKTATSKHAQ